MHGRCWDAERGSSVADAEGEVLHGGGLVDSSKPLLVVISVELNVGQVLCSHLSHHIVDIAHAARASAHRSRRKVGVTAGAVPVREELGSEGDGDVEVLSDALKNIARDPKLVTHIETEDRSDLILPLARHHLGVRTR